MTTDAIFTLIKNVLENLHETDVIAEPINVREDTLLIGDGAELDSMAFVSFFTELESAVSQLAERTVFLSLDKVTDFDSKDPKVTVSDIAQYVKQIVAA